MVFTSTVFLFLFLPVVMGIYYLPPIRRNRKAKNIFLLIASIFFYAWGEPVFVFLMLFSILVTWGVGIGLGEKEAMPGADAAPRSAPPRRKRILVIGTVYHILILTTFKYLTFLCGEFNTLVHHHVFHVEIALPIGISFFTFQMMSYLFDVYYGKAKVQKNILNLALYVSLFPQLIAGPIVRYETVEDEIMNRVETKEDFVYGVKRFLIGLGKKALLADFLAVTADNVFALSHAGGISALTGWVGAAAYMMELYFDFGGYSDMAIGLGRCFGFHFEENFNYPYLCDSLRDYWQRWHLSLTGWFRDYVYIPLGGSRVTIPRYLFNTFMVWLLTGIWHGANWTFMLWGFINWVLLLLERYVYHMERWPHLVRRVYTLLIICLWLIIFRAASVPDAFRYLGDMFGHTALSDAQGIYYLKNSLVILILGAVCCYPVGSAIGSRLDKAGLLVLKEVLLYLFLGFVFVMTAVFSISGGYSPFIYFNF